MFKRPAALGGIASKIGLASGPVAVAILLGADNYPLVIWVAVAGLVACMAAAVVPSLTQDR